MDLQKIMMIQVYFLAVIISCGAAPVSTLVVTVTPSVSVHADHTATLPCWLDSRESAERKEVRWYRPDHYDDPIILYVENKIQDSQDASYAGRASFGLKDAASTGMAEGDVSLRLVNVTIKDAGDYVCYVSSDQGYDRETVRLSVTKTGSSPLLSVAWTEDNVMNVSCSSEGWYPQPSLTWTNQERIVAPKSLHYTTVSSGLVSVHSWIQVSTSSEVSCSVGSSAGDKEEASVHLKIPPQSEVQGSPDVGWVMFALLLIGVLVLLGVLYKKKYLNFAKKSGNKSESHEARETEKLLTDVVCDVTPQIPKPSIPLGDDVCYANIDLVETNNEYLHIVGHKLRDKPTDGKGVTCLTAIRGKRGFSSGQHCWEVSLKTGNLETKKSWWLGVTSVTGSLHEHQGPPTTSNGFWFLFSSSDNENSLQFNTDPQVSLPICSRPEKIGVYLNYDKGELSFYNVEDNSLIGSLTSQFTGEVFPLLNPGIGDISPMEILQSRA